MEILQSNFAPFFSVKERVGVNENDDSIITTKHSGLLSRLSGLEPKKTTAHTLTLTPFSNQSFSASFGIM